MTDFNGKAIINELIKHKALISGIIFILGYLHFFAFISLEFKSIFYGYSLNIKDDSKYDVEAFFMILNPLLNPSSFGSIALLAVIIGIVQKKKAQLWVLIVAVSSFVFLYFIGDLMSFSKVFYRENYPSDAAFYDYLIKCTGPYVRSLIITMLFAYAIFMTVYLLSRIQEIGFAVSLLLGLLVIFQLLMMPACYSFLQVISAPNTRIVKLEVDGDDRLKKGEIAWMVHNTEKRKIILKMDEHYELSTRRLLTIENDGPYVLEYCGADFVFNLLFAQQIEGPRREHYVKSPCAPEHNKHPK